MQAQGDDQPMSRTAMKKAEDQELAQLLESEGVVLADGEDDDALSGIVNMN